MITERDGLIVVENADGVRRYSKRCLHAGGTLVAQGDGTYRCPRHGWVFDPATGRYQNGREQPLYAPTDERAAWHERGERRPLKHGEFTLTFRSHASVTIKTPGGLITTDPWYTGTAFAGGWRLTEEQLAHGPDAAAEAARGWIWISHEHTDHLSEATLRALLSYNRDLGVFTAANERVTAALLKAGVARPRIRVLPVGEWQDIGDKRLMILPDACADNDTGLLVEYAGHRVLVQVDCRNLCGGNVPEADVLLGMFAGGASSYPVCWESAPAGNPRLELDIAAELRDATRARVWVPFAGSHEPTDPEIAQRLPRNSPYAAAEHVGGWTWLPRPGSVLDVANASLEPIEAWAKWTGLVHDHRLIVRETGPLIREYTVDFRDASVRAGTVPIEPWTSMTVDGLLWREAMREGWSLDEIAIGYHARFSRAPDTFDARFWEHMGRGLPLGRTP